MQENIIEQLVKKIAMEEMAARGQDKVAPAEKLDKPVDNVSKNGTITRDDYPLSQKHPELLKGATGKGADEITIKTVMAGAIEKEDIRISASVLEMQAQIAEASHKKQFAQNMRRAAEMTRIPDETVLQMYDMLRPNRATKVQLMDMINTLETQYNAPFTAKLVSEAVEIYEKRGILL